MSEPKWIKAIPVAELHRHKFRQMRIMSRIIAIINLANEPMALDGECRHMRGPLLEGKIEGTTVTCPWHGWQYDLSTGHCLTEQWAHLRRYNCKIENGWVMIDISPLTATPPE